MSAATQTDPDGGKCVSIVRKPGMPETRRESEWRRGTGMGRGWRDLQVLGYPLLSVAPFGFGNGAR